MNLPALRAIGFCANRRLLQIEQLSQNCQIGERTFERLNQPQVIEQHRVAALKFGDPRVMALLAVLCRFSLSVNGFRNAEVRQWVAELMGRDPNTYRCAQMSYDLRRLRLHGLIERIPYTHRYQVTPQGMRIALFLTKVDARVMRPGLSQLSDALPTGANRPIATALHQLDNAVDTLIGETKLAA